MTSKHVIAALLAPSLENAVDIVEAAMVEVVPEELHQEEGILEAEVLEVIEAQQDIEDTEEAIEEMEAVSVGLEAIYDTVEAQLKQGGLDPIAAQFMNIGLESYNQRLNLKSEGVPSLEAFGGDTDRIQATTVSMEAIKQRLKEIWNAIKAAVKAALEKLIAFFARVFSSVDKLATRAKALIKKAGATKGKADGKISYSGAGFLSVGGKTDLPSVKKGLGSLEDTLGQAFSKTESGSSDFFKNLSDFAKDVVDNKDVEVSMDELKAKVKGSFTYKSPEFSGGYTFEPNDNFGYAVVSHKSASGSAEIDVPSLADVKSLGDSVLAIASKLSEGKKAVNAMKKEQDAAISAIEKMVSAVDGGKVHNFKAKAAAKIIIVAGRTNLNSPLAKLSSIAFTAGRSAVALGEKALAAYKEEKAA